jgi:DeoR/GlpR family transcriptional regulator of sugar metabolism
MTATNVQQTILHEYPYPIAKCYERMLRARTAADRCDQARYLFEVTLKYSACLAIADYIRSGQTDEATRASLACLARPSLGHWANLLRQCLRHTTQAALAGLGEAWLQKVRPKPAMVAAYRAMRTFVEGESKAATDSFAPIAFAEMMVRYRNRSIGHGAPQADHTEKFAPILEAGVLELLLHLETLKALPLVHLAEIRVERRQFVHTLTRFMGTSPVPLADHVTGRDAALLGNDKTLLLMPPEGTASPLSIHPLAIHVSDDVFLLHSCDLQHTVSYLCHHTGVIYAADHIYEDFREQFARFLDSNGTSASGTNVEAMYESCVRISLIDGVIAAEERQYLDELALRLSLPSERAAAIESRLAASGEFPAANPAAVTPAITPVLGRETRSREPRLQGAQTGALSNLLEQQTELLRALGQEVLGLLSRRPDPSQPMVLADVARRIGESAGATLGRVSPPQLARLLADVQNHGFAPGLTKTPVGYAIVEDHLAFKVTRDRDLKDEVARAAAALVNPGMRVGLDGGSTTLPIAKELALALDADALWDLIVVTNSLPVAQEFADLVERRGWGDTDSPVQILLCSGRIRAATKAIAEPQPGVTYTYDSLQALLSGIGGLDYCFVGANGLTVAHGITMPTDIELSSKRQFIDAARAPHIVADVSKFGVHYPVRIAGWGEALTVVTNRPGSPNPDLDAVLALRDGVRVVFAEAPRP